MVPICAKPPRRFRVVTADSNHPHPVAANVVSCKPYPSQKNIIWTAEFTSVSSDEGWLYLASVEDLFTREIVEWSSFLQEQHRLFAWSSSHS